MAVYPIKLVFHEKFACRIGGIEFDCFRSPAKEARILELVQGHRNFMECISAIRFLHDHGQKHGDIRRDHILIDRDNSAYRWIDFDYNYRHRENIFGYDLFGLGNILIYLVGKGDVLIQQLKISSKIVTHARDCTVWVVE